MVDRECVWPITESMFDNQLAGITRNKEELLNTLSRDPMNAKAVESLRGRWGPRAALAAYTVGKLGRVVSPDDRQESLAAAQAAHRSAERRYSCAKQHPGVCKERDASILDDVKNCADKLLCVTRAVDEDERRYQCRSVGGHFSVPMTLQAL